MAEGEVPVLGHAVQWVTASPLWAAGSALPLVGGALPSVAGGGTDKIRRPALLRFASDTFMEDLAEVLGSPTPGDLASYVAKPESFRARPPGAAAGWQPTLTQLKLYQPIHGHFSLVAASLVCRAPGLPDRAIDFANGEKVSFVLRRLGPQGEEMAWATDPVRGKGWRPLAPTETDQVASFEELLPLFPVNYAANGRKRRLLVGLVPTSSRDAYQAAPALTPFVPPDDPDAAGDRQGLDPRVAEVKTRVTDALTALQAMKGKPTSVAEQEIDASLFLLLDLAEWLATYVPTIWEQIRSGTPPAAGSAARQLYDQLSSTIAEGTTSWRAALVNVWGQRNRIAGEAQPATTLTYNLKNTGMNPTTLQSRLAAVLAGVPLPSGGSAAVHSLRSLAPASVPVPKLDPPGTRYVLRCVYQCRRCGPLRPDEVSDPSEPFVIAPFFDFDAPARPIRINMPVDTSIAGLRKFNKNVAFVISDKLRSQMESISDPLKTLKGELGATQEFNLGVICSLSIPVITICAMIVLMIFVILLNIVFWWLPFFRICLPIKLKVK